VTSLKEIHAATPVLEFNVIATAPVDEPLLMLGIDVFSDQEFRQYHFVDSQEKNGAMELSYLFSPNLAQLPSLRSSQSAMGSRWVTNWKSSPAPDDCR